MENIIAQGAEALLVKKGDILIKRRIRKGYRYPALDEQLRTRRTRSEAKIIAKVNSVINSPKIIDSNEKSKEIEMEFIKGKVLSSSLDKLKSNEALKICNEIGKNIALIHNSGIVHGDLTTSNMILHEGKIYFIDFGLAFHSSRKEDKAVDLHLLKQALESRHFKKWKEYFEEAIKGYRGKADDSEGIIKQLEKVESRGRYKGKH